MFLGQLRPELNHLRRIIDCDNLVRGLGQQLRQGSFARAEIRDGQFREE